MPHNDAPAAEHRGFCAWLGASILEATIDAVFTSEDYGEAFAAAIGAALGCPVAHVAVDGKPVALDGPYAAKKREIGMALIPEDRKTEGLMLPMSVRDNLSFAALPRLSRWGVVDKAAERDAVDRIVRLPDFGQHALAADLGCDEMGVLPAEVYDGDTIVLSLGHGDVISVVAPAPSRGCD